MSKNNKKERINRRSFLKKSTVIAVGGAVTYGVASIPLLRCEHNLLRPPGALDEDAFLAACIKCGQCLQVCPPQVVKLADIWQGFGIGTPYITPREGGCVLCAGLPCVLACPTGALNHHISEGKEAEMGLAVISNPDTCLSIQGVNDLVYRLEKLQSPATSETDRSRELGRIFDDLLKKFTADENRDLAGIYGLTDDKQQFRSELLAKLKEPVNLERFTEFVKKTDRAQTGCRICLEVCPIKSEQTIRFVARQNADSGKDEVWPEVQQSCVGCGLCEERCPTMEASITIVPRKKWQTPA